MMKAQQLRTLFVDYFVKQGHTHVPSSSLIPAQDPTLLFANAGMNQFKDIFLGKEKRSYTRAVTIQKCIRAGGKHNDLENVGFTKRHLTFFEMLGNFSFGDYFKEDAIKYAWEFLTKNVGLDPEKLYASVFREDDEAYEIWNKTIGLPTSKIVRLGEADNFWQMGDTGPCGPCSEIYIDRGVELGCGSKECAPGCSCDRFLEIWNLVFMQFNRQADGTKLPLQQKGVDTGMGLERLALVVQGKDSVFEIDEFVTLITKLEQLSGVSYAKADKITKAAFHVLADHVRSTSCAIADGCIPSNEGRGYVLRKIIRRAAMFARKLKDESIFVQLVPAVIETLGKTYPELAKNQALITKTLSSEIEKFSHNLTRGQEILAGYFAQQAKDKTITGEQAFTLYDTYGFPLELTNVIAQEQGYAVDAAGFEKHMEQQRLQSGKKQEVGEQQLPDLGLVTEFTGYQELVTETVVTGLICRATKVETAPAGERCWVITKQSPFYVECGGQVSDHGVIGIGATQVPLLQLKKIGKAIACEIQVPTTLTLGTKITLSVNKELRLATMRNHTATHILQSALMKVLGKEIKQAGSLVTPEYLRFDFNWAEQISPEQIKQIETIVNSAIVANIPVSMQTTTLQKATEQGVIAFFGEKYNPESVRAVIIPGVSAELCGGTHVSATGDIGCFKITESTSIGARRLIGVTGLGAVKLFQEYFGVIKELSHNYKVPHQELVAAITQQQETLKTEQKNLEKWQQQWYKAMMPTWAASTETIKNVPYGYIEISDLNPKLLRDIGQELLKTKPGFYVIISKSSDRVTFFATLAPTLATTLSLKDFATFIGTFGLKGGASANAVQGGGSQIPQDFKGKIRDWLERAGK